MSNSNVTIDIADEGLLEEAPLLTVPGVMSTVPSQDGSELVDNEFSTDIFACSMAKKGISLFTSNPSQCSVPSPLVRVEA